ILMRVVWLFKRRPIGTGRFIRNIDAFIPVKFIFVFARRYVWGHRWVGLITVPCDKIDADDDSHDRKDGTPERNIQKPFEKEKATNRNQNDGRFLFKFGIHANHYPDDNQNHFPTKDVPRKRKTQVQITHQESRA